MNIISNASNIIANYETIILDIWGVLHDGNQAIDHAINFLNKLKEQDKKYFVLSNSPRPVLSTYQKLVSLGIEIAESKIVTSGSFFVEVLNNLDLYTTQLPQGKAVVIGLEKNSELLNNMIIDIVPAFDDADYFIMLAFADTDDEIQYYNSYLESALKYKLPMICINPDKTVYNGSAKRYCAGYFGHKYQELRGIVHYFGKPYNDIYNYLFNKHNITKQGSIMVGDSLFTDIRGANNFGIDSVLLLTGVHKDEIDLQNLFKSYDAKPTYVLKNLII